MLLGDSLRRIAEWRREQAQQLLAAGANLLAVYNRTVGDLLDARDRGEPPRSVRAGSGDRREAATRLFALPGSEALRPRVNMMIAAHAQLRSAPASDIASWSKMLVAYEQTVLDLLVGLRRMHRRGRVPNDPLPTLDDVLAASIPPSSTPSRPTATPAPPST